MLNCYVCFLIQQHLTSVTIPVGRIMNSCMASLLPAWLPPLITLKAGTGRITSLFPARSAMCRQSGTPFLDAPALQIARDTPRIAFAPSLAESQVNSYVQTSSQKMFKESLECLLSLLVFEILGIQRTQYNLNSHVTKYNLHLKGIINVCMCISFDNTAVLILRQMLKC